MILLLLYGRCMTAVRDVASVEKREVLTKISLIIIKKKYTGMMWNHPLPQGMYFDHLLMHHSEEFLATYTHSKGGSYGNKILYKNLKFFDKIFVRKS